jgi:hypothetical protein
MGQTFVAFGLISIRVIIIIIIKLLKVFYNIALCKWHKEEMCLIIIT